MASFCRKWKRNIHLYPLEISENNESQEFAEADIETSTAQEVSAKNGDNILEVSSEFGTDYGVPEHVINGNTEDKDTDDINNDNNDVCDGEEEQQKRQTGEAW